MLNHNFLRQIFQKNTLFCRHKPKESSTTDAISHYFSLILQSNTAQASIIMKRLLFCIIATSLSLMAVAKEPESYAEASFTRTTADLGFINEAKGIARCEFEFTNTGNAPLIIIEAKASCGCTNPDYPRQPIAPGKKGKIKVKFNPAGGSGGFRKTIIVKTNGREKRTSLYLEGSIIPRK